MWIVSPALRDYSPRHALGALPFILQANDRRPAKIQIDDRYSHGGGYTIFPHMADFSIEYDRVTPGNAVLTYTDPEDDDKDLMFEWGRISLPYSDELAILFESAILAVIQKDGSFELTRVD